MIYALVVSMALAADPAAGEGKKAAQAEELEVSKLPFTPESIKRVVAFHQPKIQGCYEEHLVDKKKAPEGKLMTSFTITGEGVVKGAKVQKKGSTLKDPALLDCVVAVLSSMTFPKPADGRDHPVEIPFNLKAVN